MEQVVDLQKDRGFKSLDVQLLSLSPDSVDAWAEEDAKLDITLPTLSDDGSKVWSGYGSVAWTMGTGEPGHTFVLVDGEGRVAWVRDYGAPEHGSVMYVEPAEITRQVRGVIQQD
jgi:peroxiredoxin